MFGRKRGEPYDPYPDAVLAVLVENFPLDDNARQVIKRAVVRQRANPEASFEVIIDSPFTANWRLRPDLKDPRRVRLGDYRQRVGGAATESARAQTVNAALKALD